MNVTYYRYELVRELRDRVGLFFTAGMPLFMYLVFGASRSYGAGTAGHGNLAAHVMISMALYGAISATSSSARPPPWRRPSAGAASSA